MRQRVVFSPGRCDAARPHGAMRVRGVKTGRRAARDGGERRCGNEQGLSHERQLSLTAPSISVDLCHS